MVFGFVKGVSYSTLNVFFWMNAWYEHTHSDIIETKYGKVRERDVRFHLIPGANDCKIYTLSGWFTGKDIDDSVTLLKNLGVLDNNCAK
jgi:hypothetical protein